MEEKSAKVRKAKRKDAKRIWEIRNQLSVRKWCTNKQKIEWKKHYRWFSDKYFSDGKNLCLVLELMNEVIGYCRFDWRRNHYVVSIAIDSIYRRRGFGSYLLSRSLNKISRKNQIMAEIVKENRSSLKLFKKNNFFVYKQNRQKIYLKYRP